MYFVKIFDSLEIQMQLYDGFDPHCAALQMDKKTYDNYS